MTRFQRKNRTDIIYKGCGGFTDIFDDMYKQLWRISDEEYDYLCDTLTDEELMIITPDFKSISEIKEAIKIVNKYLQLKNKNE